MSMPMNKVLLECYHVHLLMHYLWLLSQYNGGVEELPQRPYGLQTLKYLLSGTLQKKIVDFCPRTSGDLW